MAEASPDLRSIRRKVSATARTRSRPISDLQRRKRPVDPVTEGEVLPPHLSERRIDAIDRETDARRADSENEVAFFVDEIAMSVGQPPPRDLEVT